MRTDWFAVFLSVALKILLTFHFLTTDLGSLKMRISASDVVVQWFSQPLWWYHLWSPLLCISTFTHFSEQPCTTISLGNLKTFRNFGENIFLSFNKSLSEIITDFFSRWSVESQFCRHQVPVSCVAEDGWCLVFFRDQDCRWGTPTWPRYPEALAGLMCLRLSLVRIILVSKKVNFQPSEIWLDAATP